MEQNPPSDSNSINQPSVNAAQPGGEAGSSRIDTPLIDEIGRAQTNKVIELEREVDEYSSQLHDLLNRQRDGEDILPEVIESLRTSLLQAQADLAGARGPAIPNQ